MHRHLFFASLLFLLAAVSAQAGKPAVRTETSFFPPSPAALDPAKAPGDSVLLVGPWGSGAPVNGQFQTPAGTPDWNGWSPVDLTRPAVNHWHASTYRAVNGQYSAWCGDPDIPACDPPDEAGGYGNDWNDMLIWRGAVADPAQPCVVDLTAVMSFDLEEGYDYAYLEFVHGDGTRVQAGYWDGTGTAVPVAASHVFAPSDYGPPGAEIELRFRVATDGSFSDEDCNFASYGAVQLDDVAIALSNGAGASHDFEDGTLGPFDGDTRVGVGAFAKVWTNLLDEDPCHANGSPQVAFIDDGQVVPGTGGSVCIDRCYGPGGFVPNSSGGLLGEGFHLDNGVVSPVLAWPAGKTGLRFDATVYEDDTAGVDGDPGILYSWFVRSTSDPDPAQLEAEPWRHAGLFFINDIFDGRYVRQNWELGAKLTTDPTYVQVGLRAIEIGYAIFHGFIGHNASPGPYFDDARVVAYEPAGPRIKAKNLALDAYPAGGAADMADPGALSARFDSANNVDFNTLPGDSVSVEAAPVRTGAVLTGPPRMHYRLIRNTLFDTHRTAGLPDAGSVTGTPVSYAAHAFDLPDTGFLFPGDELRYYFTASDDLDGDIRSSIMPADTTGFSAAGAGFVYDADYTMRVLPTIREIEGQPGGFTQPRLLIWDESQRDQEYDLWIATLGQLGLQLGVDYDLATRWGDDARMAARISPAQLATYTDVVFVSGTNRGGFLADQDVQLLEDWFALGQRDLLAVGTDVVQHLYEEGGASLAFARDRLGAAAFENDLPAAIGGQEFPGVATVAGNGVLFPPTDRWRDNGQCRHDRSRFRFYTLANAITPAAGAQVLAEYTDPAGATGAYPYAAVLLNTVPIQDGRAVVIPGTLGRMQDDVTADKSPAPLPMRTRVVGDILAFFGHSGVLPISGVPAVTGFAADAAPNPFNPSTTIRFTMPRDGHLSLKVFDLRGHLIRVLADGRRPAGPGAVAWDGTDATGAPASSGTYVYEARTGGQVLVGKVTMVK